MTGSTHRLERDFSGEGGKSFRLPLQIAMNPGAPQSRIMTAIYFSISRRVLADNRCTAFPHLAPEHDPAIGWGCALTTMFNTRIEPRSW
jgi:hypothetical protein